MIDLRLRGREFQTEASHELFIECCSSMADSGGSLTNILSPVQNKEKGWICFYSVSPSPSNSNRALGYTVLTGDGTYLPRDHLFY